MSPSPSTSLPPPSPPHPFRLSQNSSFGFQGWVLIEGAVSIHPHQGSEWAGGGGGKGSFLSQVMIQQETEDDVVSIYYL